MDDSNLVKIILRGPAGEVETPWAEKVGDRLFRLDNLPWMAYGVSDDDIIEADPTEHDDMFEFVRVAQPSGNRLVRVVVDDPAALDGPLQRLVTMGCHFEGANPKYVAVSVPPSVLLDEVADLLTSSNLRWEYANPTYEQLFGADQQDRD